MASTPAALRAGLFKPLFPSLLLLGDSKRGEQSISAVLRTRALAMLRVMTP